MNDSIRYIIKECVKQIIFEVGMVDTPIAPTTPVNTSTKSTNDSTSDISGKAFQKFEDELQIDNANINSVIAMDKKELSNKTTRYKMDMQTKNRLSQDNPQRKGMEVSLPMDKKSIDVMSQNIDKLNKASVGMKKAKEELDKQKDDLQKQQTAQGKTQSVLPTLQSPI